MCNSQNEQILRDIVAEKVQNGEPFTAWDVTSAARARGASEAHYQMKNTVHRMFSSGEIPGFDRTIIQTPTGPAWCYHPLGADVSNYAQGIGGSAPASTAPSSSGAQPAPAGSQTATAVADPDDAADDASAFERKQATDKDGRLPIWSDMLRSIGLTKPGETAYVCLLGYDLAISSVSVPVPGGVSVATYLVNKDGRIRIGSAFLPLSVPGTFNVKVNTADKRIEVSVA